MDTATAATLASGYALGALSVWYGVDRRLGQHAASEGARDGAPPQIRWPYVGYGTAMLVVATLVTLFLQGVVR